MKILFIYLGQVFFFFIVFKQKRYVSLEIWEVGLVVIQMFVSQRRWVIIKYLINFRLVNRYKVIGNFLEGNRIDGEKNFSGERMVQVFGFVGGKLGRLKSVVVNFNFFGVYEYKIYILYGIWNIGLQENIFFEYIFLECWV